MRRRRLLTISHSYVVALNRRLAAELTHAGAGTWDVTAIAPERYHGDLRDIELERRAGEPNELKGLPAYFTRSPHAFFYGASLARLLRGQWDCVHMWEEPFVVAGAQIAAWTPPRVPLVFATYQNLPKRYPPPFRYMEPFVLRRSSGWIAGGQTVVRALHDRPGYASRPSATIPLGVDVDVFKPDLSRRRDVLRRLGWAEGGPPVVGYLGRLVPEKGVRLMLTALGAARADWRLLIVGGGPLDAEVRLWARDHGDRVRVVPAVVHDDVPAFLNAMDVLCAPSQTTTQWTEQLGRMIIEAFACGVPVLASDSGEVPYTVGDAGIVLPERDAAAWSVAIGALLESPERRREMAARGRERAINHFSWSTVARNTLGFLENCSPAI